MDWAIIGIVSGASVAAITIVTFITQHLKPRVKAISQFWAHLVGVEQNIVTGQDRIPGLFEVIRDLKTQSERVEERLEERLDQQDDVLAKQDGVLETIRHEVEFNNGSSVKDATLRLEQGVAELTARMDEHLKPVPAAPVTTINVHTQEHP